MKKQFVIKAAQAVKNVTNSATKAESTKALNLESSGPETRCCEWLPEIVGVAKPVFSLQ